VKKKIKKLSRLFNFYFQSDFVFYLSAYGLRKISWRPIFQSISQDRINTNNLPSAVFICTEQETLVGDEIVASGIEKKSI